MITVCAVIAAYNEERSVGEVVLAVTPHAGEVVVVDDGSEDDTAARAAEAGATVLRHERNLGKGRAVRTGLAYALGTPYSHVLLIDADLQHDPVEIPRLVEQARRGVGDVVIGERRLAKAKMPAARFHANVVSTRLLSWSLGVPIADSQSGFRLVRAGLLRRLTLTATRYEIETEMLVKLVQAGAHIERVPLRHLEYGAARSNYRPVLDTVRNCLCAIRCSTLPHRRLPRHATPSGGPVVEGPT